jgi:serine/threonine protein kinase
MASSIAETPKASDCVTSLVMTRLPDSAASRATCRTTHASAALMSHANAEPRQVAPFAREGTRWHKGCECRDGSPVAEELDSEQASAATRVGRTLRGKWHLDALISTGGMAAVYAATHRNGMRGAVKILHKEVSLNVEARARFLREGYIANKVAHPGAVRALDDDVDDDGSLFVVMELLDGATLQECADAAGGRLAPDELLLIADQLLDVLGIVHELGIVHRDIKPENVFLTTEGRVKVLDFGIAGIREPNAMGRSATATGFFLGSPAYMSPEQARGRLHLVDRRTDLWSVGATMFSLLAGQPVHAGETVSELLAAVILTPVRSLATAMPEAHAQLVQVVDRALRMDPAERWPSALAMRAAVQSAYLEMYGMSLPVSAVDPPLERAGRCQTQSNEPGARATALEDSSGGPQRGGAWIEEPALAVGE